MSNLIDVYEGRLRVSSPNPNILKCWGIQRALNIAGRVEYYIPDWYPANKICLKDIKALLGDNISITNKALEKIEKINNCSKFLKGLKEISNLKDFEQLLSLYDFPYFFSFKPPYYPYLHQLQLLGYLLVYPKIAILAEQGLGKTYVALNYIQYRYNQYKGRYRALVAAPKIMLQSWLKEVEKYTDLTATIYTGNKRKNLRRDIERGKYDIIITNYDMLSLDNKEDHDFLKSILFDVVILDEGSRLKGHNSKRSLGVEQVASRIPNRVILTGTLSLGNPLDVYQPFKILDPIILGSNFYKFRAKYCVFSPYNKYMIVGYKNLDHLKLLIDPFIVVKNRKDCLDLPERTITRVYYQPTQEQIDLYNKIVTDPIVEIDGKKINVNLSILKINKLNQLLTGFIRLPEDPEVYAICNNCVNLTKCVDQRIFPYSKRCTISSSFSDSNSKNYNTYDYILKENPKYQAIKDLIKELNIDKDNKLIIWHYYKIEKSFIERILNELGISFITADDDNCAQIFETDDNILCFVGQISQGIGITLNKARYTIYSSYSLKLEDRLQSLDRNHRIGQDKNVVVYDMVAEGTIEEQILDLLDKKQDVKEFIHSKPECHTCNKFVYCFERDIKPYSNKCILYDIRAEAENKKNIKIKQA